MENSGFQTRCMLHLDIHESEPRLFPFEFWIYTSHLGFAPGSKRFLRDRERKTSILSIELVEAIIGGAIVSLNNIISKIVMYRNRYLAGDAILEVESYQESSFLPNDSRTILCTMPTIIGRHDYVSFRPIFPSPLFFIFFFLFLPFFSFPSSLDRGNNDRYYIRVPSRCYQLRPSSDVTRRISKRFVSW